MHVAFADYPRFLQLHLRGLRGEGALLSPDMFRTLHTPIGRSALGWGVQPFQGTTISVHTGSADTFFAIQLLAPELDFGIIVVTNAFSDAIEKGCIGLLKTLFSHYAERTTAA